MNEFWGLHPKKFNVLNEESDIIGVVENVVENGKKTLEDDDSDFCFRPWMQTPLNSSRPF